MSTIASRLKILRAEKGMTQEEMSVAIHINRATIASWETGRAIPDSDTIKSLADFFNCSTDYLLGRTNIRNPIETIAAHRSDDPMDELPEAARRSLEEYKEYLLRKHGLLKDDKKE